MRFQSIRESLYYGAVQGIMVWLIYAIIECCFSSLLTWFIKTNYDYTPLHWGFSILLFVIYPIIGLFLGEVCALVLYFMSGRTSFLQKVDSKITLLVMVLFTIIVAFDINLAVQYSTSYFSTLGLSEYYILAISFLIIVIMFFGTTSSVWIQWIRFIVNPWALIILILGLPWINEELLTNHSKHFKAIAALGYTGGIFLTSFLVHRVVEVCRRDKCGLAVPTASMRIILILIPIASLVYGISFFLDQVPFQDNSNLKSTLKGSGKPNVVLITMDTVRADHLSLYGYGRNTTPKLKEFSKETTLYTRAFASSDLTLSTHASIFTGLYARQHGAHHSKNLHVRQPLSDSLLTLAEILSGKGYLTMGVVANRGFLSYSFNLHQGFHYYDVRVPVHFFHVSNNFYIMRAICDFLVPFSKYSKTDYYVINYNAKEINQKVFTLLDNVKEDRIPFLLFINYMDAHWPYVPPPPYDTLYPGKDATFNTDYYTLLVREVMKLGHKISENDQNHLISQYDGGITFMDFQIGKLIDRLKELGLYDNSIIIITSDHGEAFGERNLVNHGVSVYQDQVHIPLIIRYPNTNKGRIVNELVSSVNLLPTILDTLGYDISEDFERKSLLKSEPNSSESVVSESYTAGQMLQLPKGFNFVERALFSGVYKFISSTAGKRELYDLSKDPDEKKNLYSIDDAKSRELEEKMNQWLKTTTKDEYDVPPKLNKGALDRLRALGYM